MLSRDSYHSTVDESDLVSISAACESHMERSWCLTAVYRKHSGCGSQGEESEVVAGVRYSRRTKLCCNVGEDVWHLPMGIERLVAQLRILHGQQNSPAYGEAANRVVRWEHASAGPQGLREPAV